MRRWSVDAVIATVGTVALGVLAPLPAADAEAAVPVGGCRLHDGRITESSGLVDLGQEAVTANDSGDSARVFVLDTRTCQTVGVTRYSGTAVDVEALAPAGPRAVWVGDVGDNAEIRSSVAVVRIPVGAGDSLVAGERFLLAYPDGAHDAESLVRSPSGRLLVITKALDGGAVYAAPRRLTAQHPNPMQWVGTVPTWATDAALTPDGHTLLVRGYADLQAFTFPGLRQLDRLRLPDQRQGEGMSVGTNGRILLSSEGGRTRLPVLRQPPWLRRLTSPPAPAPTPWPSPHRPTGGRAGSAGRAWTDALPHGWPLWAGAGAMVALAGAVVAARRRG